MSGIRKLQISNAMPKSAEAKAGLGQAIFAMATFQSHQLVVETDAGNSTGSMSHSGNVSALHPKVIPKKAILVRWMACQE